MKEAVTKVIDTLTQDDLPEVVGRVQHVQPQEITSKETRVFSVYYQ